MSDFKKIIGGRIKFNKYFMIFIFIFFLLVTGSTYAYFAFQEEDSVAIKGNIVSIDADLDVELVVGTDEEMVPLLDDALSNAIKGTGSTNGACVDSVGNLSCQVYKITLINNGSRLKNLTGSIELYPKEGTDNAYSNLKWRELSNTTTIKEGSVVNGMSKSTLVSNLTMESKEVRTWYIAVWISEVDSDQRETDKGDFGGTVTFEVVEDIGESFIEKKLESRAQSDESIDFSKTSVATSTDGVYVRSGTENNTNPIYYYRGDVDDNNLIFADVCWKIVRTTETGGLKLIYNGAPTDGQCNNTGTASQIGTKQFNSRYNSPAYVGYMYSSVYPYSTKTMTSITDTYYYGNDVTYSNGTYTLTDTITSSSWSSVYNGGLNSNHYTCFSTGTTCNSVYYIYYTNSTKAYYITLTDGKKVEDALTEMLGADDENISSYNTTSSTIKGNSTTSGTIDYWYYNNIELKGYSDYLEDTVWCNDRTIYQKNGWDPNGGSTTSYLYFGSYGRVGVTYQPNLICSRNIDSFTVSEANGNGDLDYPVGLLTADEIMLAGGANSANSSYYLYTGQNYWAGSPYNFHGDGRAFEFDVYSAGGLDHRRVNGTGGVRPSVSLKPGFSISGGDGAAATPYIVS